ncbi:MAG: PQQ-binding-like beta-propeller repeat protein [Rubripirellula sp.]
MNRAPNNQVSSEPMMHRLPFHRTCRFSDFIWICLLWITGANADNHWQRFRGPGGRGIGSATADLPLEWNQDKNVAWVSDVPGWGWSSPIVQGNQVFITTVVNDEKINTPAKGLYLGQGVREPSKGLHHWLVISFDLESGKEQWRREAHTGVPSVPRHPKSTYAAETPVTDGERLYVLFGDLGLWCYSLDGEEIWHRKFQSKKTFFDYGAAASPVVHGDQVFVVYDNLEDSWIASFDCKTGEEKWRQARDEKRSWATPLVWENEERTELVVPGLRRNRSYSLDGELLWEFDGQMSSLVIPSPFAAHGMLYLASGYIGDSHRPTFAVKPGGKGDLVGDSSFEDSPWIQWYQPTASPYNTSQIVVDRFLYTLYDQGFLTCHDAISGEEIYGKKRLPRGASFTSSPWAVNDKLFCLSEDGETFVIQVGENYELLSENSLDELSLACPAFVNGKHLIRTASRLYCISKRD